VHAAPSLNWGAADNQVDWIRRLNRLLKTHPAFGDEVSLHLIQEGEGNAAVMRRDHPPSGKSLLVAVNLDADHPQRVVWKADAWAMGSAPLTDLLTGDRVQPEFEGDRLGIPLAPGRVLCLSPDAGDADAPPGPDPHPMGVPPRVELQRFRAKALELHGFFHGIEDMGGFDRDLAARRLREDPLGFCRGLNPKGPEPRVVRWRYPEDLSREVMVPPGHCLLVVAEHPFRARIMKKGVCLGSEDSLEGAGPSHFAVFTLPNRTPAFQSAVLRLSAFHPEGCRHGEGPLLLLPPTPAPRMPRLLRRSRILSSTDHLFLRTNGRGAMSRARLRWGRLMSGYDALLAANLHPEFPEDRWVMFTRCRAWLVYQGYSQEIGDDCVDAFDPLEGKWTFQVPMGQGQHVAFTIVLEMLPETNTIRLRFRRGLSRPGADELEDRKPIQLILRPDIENRSFHGVTKAYSGPEQAYPAAVAPSEDGFAFAPEPFHRLELRRSGGRFVSEPELTYMVFLPFEQDRGL